MDFFDDIQIEEISTQDFVEEIYEELFDEDEESKFFNQYLNSNYDY